MSDNTASAKAKDEEIVVEKKSGNGTKSKRRQLTRRSIWTNCASLPHLVIEHGFTDFEFENENIRVRLSKMTGMPVQAAPRCCGSGCCRTLRLLKLRLHEAVDADAGLYKITSPIVGTFYRSPGPDKDSYVSEGSNVSPETTVCIVEAMKLMNEIQAEVSGEVVKIYVENGQPVEYGQPLFGIKK